MKCNLRRSIQGNSRPGILSLAKMKTAGKNLTCLIRKLRYTSTTHIKTFPIDNFFINFRF